MKATNEELTTAVIKLTSVLSYMMEFNVTLAKIAVPLATHLNEAEKYKLLSELEKMPTMARQLRESCDQLTSQEQKQSNDVKTESAAAKIEFQELSLEVEHNELKARAEAGDAEAQFQVGELFEQKSETDSEETAQFLRNAALWFEKAAKQNYAPAQYKLAETYSWDLVFPDKKNEVHYWYQKAAEQGYAQAQFALARNFKDGCWTDGSGDKEKAKYWFTKAAAQGFDRAQHELADLLKEDCVEEAIQLYQSLAEKGDTRAQIELARLYDDGELIPKNNEKSFHWYLQAAQLGEMDAYFDVGKKFLEGEGTPKNVDKAIIWLLKDGDPQVTQNLTRLSLAQLFLGQAYVQKGDLVEAYKWINLAAAYNEQQAFQQPLIERRTEIERQLTQEQIEKAQRRSSETFITTEKINERIFPPQTI